MKFLKWLLNLIWTFEDPRLGGAKRSDKWPAVEKEHLKQEPVCQLCGGSDKLNVHHIKPFHLHPELELDNNNLITLCEGKKFVNCHLCFGHLGNFKSYNETVRDDVKQWSIKINNRPV